MAVGITGIRSITAAAGVTAAGTTGIIGTRGISGDRTRERKAIEKGASAPFFLASVFANAPAAKGTSPPIGSSLVIRRTAEDEPDRRRPRHNAGAIEDVP